MAAPDLRSRLVALREQRGAAPQGLSSPGELGSGAGAHLPRIAERIERLAASSRSAPRSRPDERAVADLLDGERLAPGVIVVDRRIEGRHGRTVLSEVAGTTWPFLENGRACAANGAAFLDTETTGLAGGTGTLPFLVGVLRVDGDGLRLTQWFLTGFGGEPAMLASLAEALSGATSVVSFNGKCFDAPLLAARYRLAGLPNPLREMAHLDLLHPTRSAFGRAWPDCRLQTAERRLLGFEREDDLPGHLVPQVWFDFVREGRAEKLAGVLEHNRWDLVSLAALLARLARAFAEPGHTEEADALALSRAQARAGRHDLAFAHLREAHYKLDSRGLLELARLHRRRGDLDSAVALWNALSEAGDPAATRRLAIHHEHVRRDPRAALEYAERLASGGIAGRPEPERVARLQRKSGRTRGTA